MRDAGESKGKQDTAKKQQARAHVTFMKCMGEEPKFRPAPST